MYIMFLIQIHSGCVYSSSCRFLNFVSNFWTMSLMDDHTLAPNTQSETPPFHLNDLSFFISEYFSNLELATYRADALITSQVPKKP